MKKELKESLLIASLFVAVGLIVSFFIFFLLFGKGLQIIIPAILFSVFFIVFFILGKIPFIKRWFILKFIIALVLIAVFVKLL